MNLLPSLTSLIRILPARGLGMVLCAMLIASPTLTGQANTDSPSFKEVISLESVGSPAISPDGQTILYTRSSADWDNNRFDTEVWMARQGQQPFQLTRTEDGSSNAPGWSPDGQWVTFMTSRGDKRQVHAMSVHGGEAFAITDAENGVSRYEWSPDGTKLAYSSSVPVDNEAREKLYGEFSVEDHEAGDTHAWIIPFRKDGNLKGLEPERLHPDTTRNIADFIWSPDAKSIAVATQESNALLAYLETAIDIVDLESGEARTLLAPGGGNQLRSWSPDGTELLISRMNEDAGSSYYKNQRTTILSVDGGEAREIAEGLDENLGYLYWFGDDITGVAWQKTKRMIVGLNPSSGEHQLLTGGPDRIMGLDVTPDGSIAAVVGMNNNRLSEIYRMESGQWTAVTDMNAQVEDWMVGDSEMISWTSQDGAEIEGVLYKPDGFDPSKKYPLLVVIHGGPTGIDYPAIGRDYVYPISQWMQKGALVLRPNYRGSAGYGEDFRSLNVKNLGVGDMWDVMSGVDHVIGMGIVDEDRMGSMGWSQGGYISAFLTTNTDRFKAISVGAGISDWRTYYVSTDIHPFTRQYLKANPWVDPEVYQKTSPMTNILKASTPTLIQHGEFDRRVPISNAYELYQGLQDVGAPTKLIVYKGFGHGISKPKERLAAVWHNWQWFAEHVWGETVEIPEE